MLTIKKTLILKKNVHFFTKVSIGFMKSFNILAKVDLRSNGAGLIKLRKPAENKNIN
jgi:hypothetical protein